MEYLCFSWAFIITNRLFEGKKNSKKKNALFWQNLRISTHQMVHHTKGDICSGPFQVP